MKILENLLKEDQEIEEESSKFRWICTDGAYDLEEINLETMEKTNHKISLPTNHSGWNNCICSLPRNKTFCYRGPTRWHNLNGIAFIIDENHEIEVLPSEISTIGFCAIFYHNFVYMFGEFSVFRYGLAKRRWEKLKTVPCSDGFCTCISLNDMILLTWYESWYVFVFDLWNFSFSTCTPKIEKASTKVLCKSENLVYLIEFSGLIWQCKENDIYIWNVIGKCEFLSFGTFSTIVFYKNSWYFNIDDEIMKFNLDKMVVSKTNCRISYEN